MTFTLIEFLAGGIIPAVAVGMIVATKERKARREELKAVRDKWLEKYGEAMDEQQIHFREYRKSKNEALNDLKNERDHYKKGLRLISDRQYLQIGQAKAPGATFVPPWEIAEKYLKEPAE